jgi:carboxymethylenebutenolidase
VIVDSSVTCLDINGFPVGIESYVPTETLKPLPTVVMLHGRNGPDGIAGDRSYRDIAVAIASAGFHVVLPRYFERTRPLETIAREAEMDAIGREIENYGLWIETVREVLRRESRINCRVGLIGYSLGGYLALTAAMAWRGVAAVVVCYAGIPTPFVGLVDNLPPTLILHGAQDQVIPVSEASGLAKLLRRHRITHELHIYREAAHGFCGADSEDAVERTVNFLRQYLDS